MSNILQVAFTTEGSTDIRFLGNIIEKTFVELLFESNTEIEIHSPVPVFEKGPFQEKIQRIAKKYNYFHVICVHCDSDSPTDAEVLNDKISPAFSLVADTEDCCQNMVAIIPVQMTEAWMLADIELLLNEINTTKSRNDLNLPTRVRNVESISDPKERIEKALILAQRDVSRRRKKLKISDLYSPISQKVDIQSLELLPSYLRFKESVRESLVKLNYLNT